jgi:arylsulfatase A-like enzyme
MNVIWIVSDTLRRDHVGAYGNKKIHTPVLDTLAAKSIRFDRHYAASFPTMPTRADFMTGRWTVAFMKWEPLPKEEVSIAELLFNNGINTAAVVDTPFYRGTLAMFSMSHGMNYDRGFRTFEDIPGQLSFANRSRREAGMPNINPANRLDGDCCAPRTFAKAMQWLGLNYKDDFFLYIDTWDPHEAWNAPNYYTELYWPGYDGELISSGFGFWQTTPGLTEEKLKKANATYCGEVTMVDTWVGYLLRQVENMGLMENTAIVFTTDHGTYFGEHGGRYGKMAFSGRPGPAGPRNMPALARCPLYEENVAIPLFIYVPGISPGTYGGLTSAIDLMPTVLDVMGQEIPSRVEGRSLLPMIKDTSLPGYEHVFSSLSFYNKGEKNICADGPLRNVDYDSMSTVTTDEWSLLYDTAPGGSELYNLKSDPKQEVNVISQHSDIARELHRLFVKHMRDTNVPKQYFEPRQELRL